MAAPHFRRILLKLSGEALQGMDGGSRRFDSATLSALVRQLGEIHAMGVQCAIVVGGGNLFRGQDGEDMTAATADYMGMLATCINGLALRDWLTRAGLSCLLQSALPITSVIAPYQREEALQALAQGQIVIFVGGTGHPFFTTDTAAALRAVEMEASVLLKATKVDGVYSKDPAKHKDSTRYERLTYDAAIQQNLAVMDSTAFTICRDHHMPLVVFGLFREGALKRVLQGEREGTLIQ